MRHLALLALLLLAACAEPHFPFRLTYFDAKGRAEKIRLLFRFANKTQDLIDHRIEAAKWPTLKPKTPFGQLPILRHKDARISQSVAILTYCARTLGLSSYQEESFAQMLAIALGIEDLKTLTNKHKAAKDDSAIRAELKKYAQLLEKQLKGDAKYFVEERASFADITVYDMYEQLLVDHFKDNSPAETIRTEFESPKLAKIYETVRDQVEAVPLKKDEL